VINLLLVKDDEKSHYVLKSMSALLYQNYNGKGHGTVHICPCCTVKTFRSKEELTNHLENGCAKFGVRTKQPTVKEASNYVRFRSTMKMLKKPFVIYADGEAILNAIDEKTKQTTKYQKHIHVDILTRGYQQYPNMIKTLLFTELRMRM